MFQYVLSTRNCIYAFTCIQTMPSVHCSSMQFLLCAPTRTHQIGRNILNICIPPANACNTVISFTPFPLIRACQSLFFFFGLQFCCAVCNFLFDAPPPHNLAHIFCLFKFICTCVYVILVGFQMGEFWIKIETTIRRRRRVHSVYCMYTMISCLFVLL